MAAGFKLGLRRVSRIAGVSCLGSVGWSVAIAGLHVTAAYCQTYPAKPIRIVTAEAGGGADFMARLLAQGYTASLGQQSVVDNRGGASGAIAAQAVAKSAPDGYTLLFYSNGMWTLPLLQDVPYDAIKDFLPVVCVASSPNIVVVHPSLPVKSIKDLIALAKARPGELNYSMGGTGTTPHLAAELFKSMANVNIVRVNYKGAGPALNDLIGGQVQLTFATTASGAPHVKSGRLRALAVTSAEPSTLVPGLPTIAASGLPGYESIASYGLFAPAKTQIALVQRLNEETVKLLNTPDVKQKLFNISVEVVGGSPEAFAGMIKIEINKWGKVVRDAGIRDQ